MTIEQRLIRIEKKLDRVLNFIDENINFDYSNRKFICLENIFDFIDKENPMVEEGCIYTIKPNNSIDFHYGNHNTTFSSKEFVEKYGDKIQWLTNK